MKLFKKINQVRISPSSGGEYVEIPFDYVDILNTYTDTIYMSTTAEIDNVKLNEVYDIEILKTMADPVTREWEDVNDTFNSLALTGVIKKYRDGAAYFEYNFTKI